MTINSICRREIQGKNRSTNLYKLGKFKLPIGFEMLLIKKDKKCRLLIKFGKVDVVGCRNGQQNTIDETKFTKS